jgi:PilZ domain-containing protein
MPTDRSKRKARGGPASAPPLKEADSQPAKRRSVRRCPFVASAEVIDLSSQTSLSGRTSELALGGCYIETLNPFAEGTLVQLRILRDQGVFETRAKVVYCHRNCGMGLSFSDIAPHQRSLLEDWLAEMVLQLRSPS